MPLAFLPSKEEFERYLGLQLRLVGLEFDQVRFELEAVYPELEEQFQRTKIKYFRDERGPVLRVANNVQYTIVLYRLSRKVFEAGRALDADRIYSLLRMVSSVDLYHQVALPDVWGCDHPLGTVIGRGEFAPRSTFFFSHNCNIGNNRSIYPRISGNLLMLPNSTLLGDTSVTGNVILANGACVIDAGELKDCYVFGRSPELTLKPLSMERFSESYPLHLT